MRRSTKPGIYSTALMAPRFTWKWREEPKTGNQNQKQSTALEQMFPEVSDKVKVIKFTIVS